MRNLTWLTTLLATSAVGQGSWGPVIGIAEGWPQTSEGHAVHLVHLRPTNLAMGNKGRFLFWGPMSPVEGPSNPRIWNPYGGGPSGTWTVTAINGALDYDLFCAGQTLLGNGKVIVCGSYFVPGNPSRPLERVSVFDPSTDTWNTQVGYWMTKKRYYPTVIRMPYGEIVVAGGQDEEGPSPAMWADDGPYEYNEEINSAQAQWKLPTTEDYDFLNYPHIFPLSATEVFFAGNGRHGADPYPVRYQTFSFPLSTFKPDSRVPLGGYTYIWEDGGTVMIRPRVVFKCGGLAEAQDSGSPPASNRSERIDLTAHSPAWIQRANMNVARIEFNLVLMPDGRAIAIGGSTEHNLPATGIYATEIYDYDTNTWTLGPPSASGVFRGYHSTASLMPDGRIVVAGSNNAPFASAQIYSPAYTVGGTRPNIISGPDAISLGKTFEVVVDDPAVNEACLVALTATTHGFDANQRYIPLTLSGAGTTKTVNFSMSATDAPLGYYMLFVLKPNGSGGKLLCNLAKYLQVDVFTD